MTLKDKILYTMISIITFGIYPIVIKKKVKKASSGDLAVKQTIDSSVLIQALGGKENIASAEYTQTKIKIFIKNKDSVKLDEIEQIKGVSGVVANSKNVSIIVGKQAKLVAESLM